MKRIQISQEVAEDAIRANQLEHCYPLLASCLLGANDGAELAPASSNAPLKLSPTSNSAAGFALPDPTAY